MNKTETSANISVDISKEDHLLKTSGDAPLIIAMDRLAIPKKDIRRLSRLKAGASKFVEWYGECEKKQDKDVIVGTKNLRKNFSRFISSIKEKNSKK